MWLLWFFGGANHVDFCIGFFLSTYIPEPLIHTNRHRKTHTHTHMILTEWFHPLNGTYTFIRKIQNPSEISATNDVAGRWLATLQLVLQLAAGCKNMMLL